MPGAAVVLLDGDGVFCPNHMAFGGQNFGESLSIVGVECTVFQVVDFFIQSLDTCSITAADTPGNSSPRTPIHGFDKPELVFLSPQSVPPRQLNLTDIGWRFRLFCFVHGRTYPT